MFQCFKVRCLEFKANSVKEQRIIFLELTLERKDKFDDTTRSSPKAGKLFKTLLTSLNFYSYWVGCYQLYWTGKLPELRNFQHADIWNMQPTCITGQRKLLLIALDSSTSSSWSYVLYTKVGRRFAELFVYTVLDFLRYQVCSSLYAVRVNPELKI